MLRTCLVWGASVTTRQAPPPSRRGGAGPGLEGDAGRHVLDTRTLSAPPVHTPTTLPSTLSVSPLTPQGSKLEDQVAKARDAMKAAEERRAAAEKAMVNMQVRGGGVAAGSWLCVKRRGRALVGCNAGLNVASCDCESRGCPRGALASGQALRSPYR